MFFMTISFYLILLTRLVTSQSLDEVDRPVPVQKMYVSVGDRVELPCDVSLSPSIRPNHFGSRSESEAQESGSSYPALLSANLDPRSSRASRPVSQWSRSHSTHIERADKKSLSPSAIHQDMYGQYGAVPLTDYYADMDNIDPNTEEGAYLVLWFIDPDRKPIYSFDVRGRPVTSGRHWWDERRFDRRAHFLLPTSSRVARLQIFNVSTSDAGHYRCRVDYKNAPTRNFKYHLIVVEPPNSVQILDRSLQQLSTVAGPVGEGDDLQLTCKAQGGYPTPWVTWWHGGQLLDNLTDGRGPDSISNLLVFPRVTRRNLHDAFTCQVTASPHVAPIMKIVTLELHLKPLFVEILLPSKPLLADQSIEVQCRTAGSRPPPTITWWKGNKQIQHGTSIKNSDDGNVTVSVLILTPTADDDGKHLICRAKNSMIPDAVLEDSLRLEVQYPPIVGLALGSNINGDDIKEGDDLYLECHIRANPNFQRLVWIHNGSPVYQNISAGVVLSNVSLVLRAVSRSRAGLYTCAASNSRGETNSQPLHLRIQYTPRCQSNHGGVVGVSRQETATLDCQVDADPSDVHFWWTFLGTPMKSNGSALVTSSGDAILIPRQHFTTKGPRSRLSYSPKSELDFGMVACWASNSVGNQREPCLFHVVPAGKPTAPSNCTIHNQTADSIRVDCQEAFDGGLQQTFGLEILDPETRHIRLSFSNNKPSFVVRGLEPETAFLFSIFALNAKGRSDEIGLEATTLRAAEKHTGPALNFQMTPLLAVLVGAAVTLLLVVLTVAVVVHRRQKRKRKRVEHETTAVRSPNECTSIETNTSATLTRMNKDETTSDSSTLEASVIHSHIRPHNGHPICTSNNVVFQKEPDIIMRDMEYHMKTVLPAVMQKAGISNHRIPLNLERNVILERSANEIRNPPPDLHPHQKYQLPITHWDGYQPNGILQQDILSDTRLPESSL